MDREEVLWHLALTQLRVKKIEQKAIKRLKEIQEEAKLPENDNEGTEEDEEESDE
jgi:DNA-directed RNA polymerase sigma subunit (sigma70/sigma32)